MKKTVVEQLYYDFYGELLSDRQKTVLDYYYNDDCSIAEIAELTRMTRQGAYDACKRGRKQMEAYEKKLGLVGRFQKNRQLLSGIVEVFEVTMVSGPRCSSMVAYSSRLTPRSSKTASITQSASA